MAEEAVWVGRTQRRHPEVRASSASLEGCGDRCKRPILRDAARLLSMTSVCGIAGETTAMASTNKLNPIPHPPKKPVVGNMLSLDANAPVQHLVRLTKELGPIFWLDMMGAPLGIVGGHDLIEELSDEKRFDKAVRGSLRRVRAVGGDGLFTADTSEPNWSKAHNILMQPFGNRAMQSYHSSMVDIAEQLVKNG